MQLTVILFLFNPIGQAGHVRQCPYPLTHTSVMKQLKEKLESVDVIATEDYTDVGYIVTYPIRDWRVIHGNLNNGRIRIFIPSFTLSIRKIVSI